MADRARDAERTWPLGSVARLTGLSPELLRAWERRHAAVTPLRTPGGTRRYRAADLERLHRLKAAVAAGHRIGELVPLSDAQLDDLAREPERVTLPGVALEAVLAALEAFDAAEAQRLLALQLAALGASRFARETALPLVREIGERWAHRRLSVASEHLASGVLRSLLGSALLPNAAALRGPRIVFATFEGERHELGLLVAALTALGAGANPIYLGCEVPVPDLVLAAERSGAAALGISIVASEPPLASSALAELRAALPAEIQLWIGGAHAGHVALPAGVDRLPALELLEQRVALLGERTRMPE
jgi:DNA-binding transcriptional MerR regulator